MIKLRQLFPPAKGDRLGVADFLKSHPTPSWLSWEGSTVTRITGSSDAIGGADKGDGHTWAQKCGLYTARSGALGMFYCDSN